MQDPIVISKHHRIGQLTLNRPQALNSLTLDMVRTITQALLAWRDDPAIDAVMIDSRSEKAFCAGGDIRFFYQAGYQTPQQGSALIDDFFTEEYALNHLIHHYPKPYIALMNGIVMGGGMGIAQCFSEGRLRIVTERTKMAMPEVNIGLFPDVGGSYFLSRCPDQTGLYLALTGHVIGAADAIHAGLADVFIPSAELGALKELVATCAQADVTAAVRAFARQFAPACGAGELAGQQLRIARHFAHAEMAAIVASLKQDPDPFAQAALAAIQKRSPLMLCVTLQQLRRGAGMDLAGCLRMERSMVRHSFTRHDVFEGIRATVIDKDMHPVWSPATLEAVSQDMVDSFFTPAWPDYMHPLRTWL